MTSEQLVGNIGRRMTTRAAGTCRHPGENLSGEHLHPFDWGRLSDQVWVSGGGNEQP